MLNYTKKYINIVALCITIFIFAIFIIFDVSKMQKREDNKRYENIENSIKVENAYIEVSKKFKNSLLQKDDLLEKTSMPQEENSVQSGSTLQDESSSTKANAKAEEEEIEKLTNINIYSTNKWRIKIPKINVDAPIAEGTSQEALRRTVGHFENTDTWKGNVALAGHNRGYRCNFFQDIKKMQKGDLIIYSTEKGVRKYEVVVNTVIEETDWSYIENTKDNRITLITCETGKKEYRRCIQAVEIKE